MLSMWGRRQDKLKGLGYLYTWQVNAEGVWVHYNFPRHLFFLFQTIVAHSWAKRTTSMRVSHDMQVIFSFAGQSSRLHRYARQTSMSESKVQVGVSSPLRADGG
jgi:hypothetical protein